MARRISLTARSMRGRSNWPLPRSAAVASSVMFVAGLAVAGVEAEGLAVGGQRHAAAGPGPAVRRGQGEFLGRQNRGAVRGQALAVTRVRAADRPFLHRGEDLEHLGPGDGLL